MKKISILGIIIMVLIAFAPSAQAQTMNNPVLPVAAPEVSNITSTSATFSLPQAIVNTLDSDQLARLYFQYIPSKQVCILIYPTPENCLPKKTTQGALTANVPDLKPSTSYSVNYKVDNTINCITTPCPSNEVQSGSVEFTTTTGTPTTDSYTFNRNLGIGSKGNDVLQLQNMLHSQGYMTVASNGYFGPATYKAVRAYQSGYMHIGATGFVGPKTRLSLNTNTQISTSGTYFQGVIDSASTGCYSDGICSITISGKKVVTTIGWSQEVVGSIKGSINNVGDAQNKIGVQANVYAAPTSDGNYTLYGNSAYYIIVQ